MATIKEIKTTLRNALYKSPSCQFSTEDSQEVFIAGLFEHLGMANPTPRQIKQRENEIFALIEEEVDLILPKALEDVVGGFAEVRSFALNEEPIFKVKGLGKKRARLGIVPGARAGIYKARRLDNTNLTVAVDVETIGIFLSLTDILLGTYTLSDLFTNILDGFKERVYIKSLEALKTASSLAPAANSFSGVFDGGALRDLVRIAGAYGTPVIMGFKNAISKIENVKYLGDNAVTSEVELNELRNSGIVSIFEGTKIVELPNYICDEAKNEFVFDENELFVLPTDSKPVKISLKGDLTIIDSTHTSGSIERNIHKLIGVALLLANDICVYTLEEESSD